MSLRKRPKQKRSLEMVSLIIEAAIDILKSNKSSFTTINIAERAGISVGSLYQYFKNKEEILIELISSFIIKQNEDIYREILDIKLELENDKYIEEVLNTFYNYMYQDLEVTRKIMNKSIELGVDEIIENEDKKLIENLYNHFHGKFRNLSPVDFNVLVILINSLNNEYTNHVFDKEMFVHYSKKITYSVL